MNDSLSARVQELGMRIDESPIEPGDTYVAGGARGIQILTCKKVNEGGGWVVPQEESGYFYDLDDCVKIKT